MGIIFLLLPLSIVLAVAFLVAYLWGVNQKQFEDLETPPLRMLHDEEEQQ